MLKIKDFVDLKELEKFEFRTTENSYCWFYRLKQNKYDYVEISVDFSREITIYATTEYRDTDIPDKIIDKLFDLIQAGLVEKVEAK